MFSSKLLKRRITHGAARAAAGWVNAAIEDERERARQERMLKVLLLGAMALPFLAVPTLAFAASPTVALTAGAVLPAACLIVIALLNLTASRIVAASAAAVFAALGAAALLQSIGLGAAETVAAGVVAMLGGPAAFWLGRRTGKKVRSEPAPASDFDLQHLPGLATLHDDKGMLVRAGGLEREAFSGLFDLAPGRTFVATIHVADRLFYLQAFDRLRQGEPQATARFRVASRRTPGGPFVPVVADLVALRDREGALSRVLVQTRRDGEAALREENAVLTEKAAGAECEKTRFLAAVSHEMRTPLNAIIGFSEILAREFYGPLTGERQRDYVGLIRRSGDHLLAVVNAMLDMSRIETGRYRLEAESFPVAEVVSECTAMLALEAERRGLTLTTRVPRSSGTLMADRRAVKQVLINLIGNAIKFTEAGGVVTVDAVRMPGAMRLVVADTGAGMEGGLLERIGQPFVQGEADYANHHEGTGLGLCLVKGLVALHGGTMAIDSAPGRGTAVTIDLPLDGSFIAGPEEEKVTATAFPPRLKRNEDEPQTHDAGKNDAAKKTA